MAHCGTRKFTQLIMQGTMMAVLIGCGVSRSAAEQPTPPAPSPTSLSSVPIATDLQRAMLSAHNDARAAVGVGPVAWDTKLSAAAAAYARELAANGRFEHSSSASRPDQGENLWAGTTRAYSFEQMAGGWIDERRYFIAAVFPHVSTTGNWQDVGHYSQIIWRNTTRIGCGIASNRHRDILVCRYSSPGNFTGQRVF